MEPPAMKATAGKRRTVVALATTVVALATYACSRETTTGPSTGEPPATGTIGPSGGSVSLGSGTRVDVAAGATASVYITLSETPRRDPQALTDSTYRVHLQLASPSGTRDSTTLQLAIPLPRAVPSDSSLAMFVQFDGDTTRHRYWAETQTTAPTGAPPAEVRHSVTAQIRTTMRLPSTSGVSVGLAIYPFLSPNLCANIYRLQPASGAPPLATASVTLVLVHGIQLDRFCGASDAANTGWRLFADYDPEPAWSPLIAAVRAAFPGLNIYVYRYPTVYHPRVSGADLLTRIQTVASGPGSVVLVAHSMGGLVSRYAAGDDTRNLVRALISLATPHFGTPAASPGSTRLWAFYPWEGLRALAVGAITDLPWPPGALDVHVFSGAVPCNRLPSSASLWPTHVLLCQLLDGGFGSLTTVADGIVPLYSSEPTGATSVFVAPSPLGPTDHFEVLSSEPIITGVVDALRRYAALSVTGVSPSNGALAGGTAVTITGANFPTTVDSVRVGAGKLTGLSRVSSTQLTGTTPASSTSGAKDVIVYATASGSATCSACFTYNPPVTVTGISPAVGPLAGGTNVTITGTNFINVSAVTIGGSTLTNRIVVSSTQITGVTPASAATGAMDVSVVSFTHGAATCRGFFYSSSTARLLATSGQAALITGPSDLYDVPPVSCGTDRLIGRVRTASGFQPIITDIAVAPNGGVWGISWDSLYRIDPLTALATTVGALGVPSAVALAFDSAGGLFGAAGSSFFRVDTTTGRATVIGNFGGGVTSQGDVVFLPGGRLLGAAFNSSGESVLIAINGATGQATQVGAIGFNLVWGLAYVAPTLFGMTSDRSAATGSLIIIDTGTGAGTLVRALGFDAFGGGAVRQHTTTRQ
jgi:hypothetical protein